MALKNFIKENFVLAAGLALPVLLVALFFLATVLPRSMATPPQYKMLFTTVRYDYQNPPAYGVDFLVRDGVLKARVSKTSRSAPNYYQKKLMIYDGKTQNVREITYDASRLATAANGAEITLEETRNMRIDTAVRAPDGYAFENPDYRSGGLALEIFSGGDYRAQPRVTKGGVAFKIPLNGNGRYSYYDLQFIGWIIKG